jgi:hypothetical protein
MASQQIEDVRAVAKVVLSDEDFVLANAVLNFAKKIAEQRNDLAHSLWGYSEDIPDGIVAVHSGHYTMEHFKRVSGDHVALRFEKQKFKEVWVYKERDLIDLIEQIQSLWSYIPMLDSLNTDDVAERAKVWSKFRSDPAIRDMLPSSP